MVAVHYESGGVGQDAAVAVAVEGQAEVGPDLLDPLGHRLRMRGAAPRVDVAAVGLVVHGGDARAQLLEEARGQERGRTVGAVDREVHPFQGRPAERALQVGEVGPRQLSLLDSARLAHRLSG